MAKRCRTEACKREAEMYCYHCSQDVCSKHFFEHKKWIQEQLPLLTDEVNLTFERLRHKDNAQTSVPPSFINIYGELDKWREGCRQQIDFVYERVRNQIEDIVEKHKHNEKQPAVQTLKSLESLRQQLNEVLKEGDVTYRQLETMKQELEKIKMKELKQIQYPDIRVITQKFDASKYINIIINTNHSTYEKQQPRHMNSPPWLGQFWQQSNVPTASSDKTNDKCPVCFMIFTSNTTIKQREQHVEDHNYDD